MLAHTCRRQTDLAKLGQAQLKLGLDFTLKSGLVGFFGVKFL